MASRSPNTVTATFSCQPTLLAKAQKHARIRGHRSFSAYVCYCLEQVAKSQRPAFTSKEVKALRVLLKRAA